MTSAAELAVGVDLGGTKIQAALVDAAGRVLASHRLETDVEAGPSKVTEDVARCVRACAPDFSKIVTVGVGVAGQVARESGRVYSAPNLRWTDFPLRERLERDLGVPVAVENDVRAIAWGEWKHGAGRAIDDLIVMFVGTGVGGGVVSGGRMLTGDLGIAGELGHMTLVAGGRPCTCGNHGCLEAYAGGWAIAERAREAAQADPEAGRELLTRSEKEPLTARVVSEAAEWGDPLAKSLLEETGSYLGRAMVGLVHIFNPRRIVLGGGVIDGNPDLVAQVEAVIRDQAIAVATERLEVRRSKLGQQAGVIGSATLALHRKDAYGTGTTPS
ncbi:MAG: ROK family protein [Candidatus Palauibacterales bacterium]|nr:ROK family protein [Candidatus Palauibacterales bacterium]MDP2482217.1 ROK family protein [Candidatus Palauibacterales bacterium]